MCYIKEENLRNGLLTDSEKNKKKTNKKKTMDIVSLENINTIEKKRTTKSSQQVTYTAIHMFLKTLMRFLDFQKFNSF